MIKTAFFTILFAFSTNAFSDCCICQTDTSPQEHIKWYKTGCRMWLTARGCPAGKIISQKDNIEKYIPKSCEGKKLKLGYVGHWASARDTVDYLSSILGVLEKKNLSLYYDNTACLAMDNPQTVQNFLNKVSPKLGKRNISVKGNQAISTGMWDPILPGKHNFKAVASTEAEVVSYPKCSKFIDKGCWARFQDGETGLCLEKDGSKSILRCTKDAEIEYYSMKRSPNGKTQRRVKKKKKATVWKRVPVKKEKFEILGGSSQYRFYIRKSADATNSLSHLDFFESEKRRDEHLTKLKKNIKTLTDKDYKDIKFEIKKEEIEDWKVVDGKYSFEPTGKFTSQIIYQDPITENFYSKTFRDDEKGAKKYMKDINSLKAKDEKKNFENMTTDKKMHHERARVHNKDIGFIKRFKNGKEAKAYIQKVQSSNSKELRDLIYCNYLGKH